MKFIDAAGNYSDYTSDIIVTRTRNNQRGVIQVDVTDGSTISIQARINDEAPWLTVETYSASTISEIVLAPNLRVVVTGTAKAWLSETR